MRQDVHPHLAKTMEQKHWKIIGTFNDTFLILNNNTYTIQPPTLKPFSIMFHHFLSLLFIADIPGWPMTWTWCKR